MLPEFSVNGFVVPELFPVLGLEVVSSLLLMLPLEGFKVPVELFLSVDAATLFSSFEKDISFFSTSILESDLAFSVSSASYVCFHSRFLLFE